MRDEVIWTGSLFHTADGGYQDSSKLISIGAQFAYCLGRDDVRFDEQF